MFQVRDKRKNFAKNMQNKCDSNIYFKKDF